MDVDAPTGNPSGQHANNRTLRSAVVQTNQDERDGRETSLSSTASAARSARSTPSLGGNNI
ncbi:hypothetical protein MKW98_026601, partial [Papaver atlanticum]